MAGVDAGQAAWWQDLYFAMLNSSGFVLNHEGPLIRVPRPSGNCPR
jgi:hypothetical protein